MSSHCFLLGGCRSYHFKDMGIVGCGLRAVSLVVIFGIIWLSLVGILANHEMTTRKVTVIPSTVSFKHWKLVGREKHHVHQNLEFFHYVSKRRVPNGPDPIHNRYILIPSHLRCINYQLCLKKFIFWENRLWIII